MDSLLRRTLLASVLVVTMMPLVTCMSGLDSGSSSGGSGCGDTASAGGAPATPPPPDTTSPTLSAHWPSATWTRPDTKVHAVFSESVNLSSVGPDTFYITDSSGGKPSGRYAYGSGMEFTPDRELLLQTVYTAVVTAGVRDLAGNALNPTGTWTFTTGPGGVGSWRPMSLTGAPSQDGQQLVAWTGTLMVVYGVTPASYGYGLVATGGRYDPGSDTWRPVSRTGAHAYQNFGGAWTGRELAVWGGQYEDASGYHTTAQGRLYDPATDTWRPMSTVGAPSPRQQAMAVWTGTELIVWDGWNGGDLQLSGGRYDPLTDSWRGMSGVGGMHYDYNHRGYWTGSRLLVIGSTTTNYVTTLAVGLYDPVADAWSTSSVAGAPSWRLGYGAVWTGSELLIWGGETGASGSVPLNDGACYSPFTDTWRPMSMAGAPPPRTYSVGVWTGDRMIVWGGFGEGDYGGLYDPVSNTWTIATYANSPTNRTGDAVWTGSEMFIRAGYDSNPINWNNWGSPSTSRGDRFRP